MTAERDYDTEIRDTSVNGGFPALPHDECFKDRSDLSDLGSYGSDLGVGLDGDDE